MLAEFDTAEDLLAASKAAYGQGYRHMDAYAPFPVHGLSEAIGFTKTHVPFFTLMGGLTGAVSGCSFQGA